VNKPCAGDIRVNKPCTGDIRVNKPYTDSLLLASINMACEGSPLEFGLEKYGYWSKSTESPKIDGQMGKNILFNIAFSQDFNGILKRKRPCISGGGKDVALKKRRTTKGKEAGFREESSNDDKIPRIFPNIAALQSYSFEKKGITISTGKHRCSFCPEQRYVLEKVFERLAYPSAMFCQHLATILNSKDVESNKNFTPTATQIQKWFSTKWWNVVQKNLGM
jgi:hypothetical protein